MTPAAARPRRAPVKAHRPRQRDGQMGYSGPIRKRRFMPPMLSAIGGLEIDEALYFIVSDEERDLRINR